MPNMIHRLACALLVLALQPALGADVLTKETLATTRAGGGERSTRSIAIKGERMRISRMLDKRARPSQPLRPVTNTPLEGAPFAVPDGWKRQQLMIRRRSRLSTTTRKEEPTP